MQARATFSGVSEEGAAAAATPTPQPAPTSTLAIPESTVTPVPTSTIPIPPTATASAESTPTADESLREFVFCDRLLATKSILWGQTPSVIYSGNPHLTGEIVPGDYVLLLMPQPNADGMLRVLVYPHDFRPVGQTDNMVWIDWGSLVRFRLDRIVLTCEPAG